MPKKKHHPEIQEPQKKSDRNGDESPGKGISHQEEPRVPSRPRGRCGEKRWSVH